MIVTAVALSIAVVAYFLLTTLVELPPLNNVGATSVRERRTEALVNLPAMLAPVVLLAITGATGAAWPAWVAGAIQTVVVVGGLLLWWAPYLAGVSMPWATAGTGTAWHELHARTYAKTLIVLPAIGDRPRPNLEHMILHGLMVAAAVAAFAAAGEV